MGDCNIWFKQYVETSLFQILHWKGISIAHVIIITKSSLSTLPRIIISFRGCVPEMFVRAYSVTYCIYITAKQDFVFIIIVQFMMSANSRQRFGLLVVFVCLYFTPSHYHQYAKLSEDTELIKCLSDIFCRVCKFEHIFSVINYTIYGAECFQFTHLSCDGWDNIHFVLLSSSNRKYGLLCIV